MYSEVIVLKKEWFSVIRPSVKLVSIAKNLNYELIYDASI